MFRETEPRLLIEAPFIGAVGALAAYAFAWSLRLCERVFLAGIAGYRPPGLPDEGGVLKQSIGPHGLWLIPIATTLGGLGNVKVQKLISKLVEMRAKRLDLTGDKVLEELSRMAFANMLDYVKTQADGSAYIDLSKLTREQAAAIQEITIDEYTEGRGEQARNVKRTRFKMADKRGSLELLGRHLAMFTDRTEASGPGGGAIPVSLKPEEMSLADLAAEIRRERSKKDGDAG